MWTFLLLSTGCKEPASVTKPAPPALAEPSLWEGDWGDLVTQPGGAMLVRSAMPGDDWLDDGFGRPVRPRLHRVGPEGVTEITPRADLVLWPFAGGTLLTDLAPAAPALVYLDSDGRSTVILEGVTASGVRGGAAWARDIDNNYVLYAPAHGEPVSLGSFVPWDADPDLRCVVGWNDGALEVRDLVAGTSEPVPVPPVDTGQAVVAPDCAWIALMAAGQLRVRGTDGTWRPVPGVDPDAMLTLAPGGLVASRNGVWWVDLEAGAATELGEDSIVLSRSDTHWLLGLGPHEAYCYAIASLDLVTGALASSGHLTCMEIIGYGHLDGPLAQWADPAGRGMLSPAASPADGAPFCEQCLHPALVSPDGAWLAVADEGGGAWTRMTLVSAQTLEAQTLAEGFSYDAYWMDRTRWWGSRLAYGVETIDHPWLFGPCPSELRAVTVTAPEEGVVLGQDVVDVEVDSEGTLAFVVGGPRFEGACPDWSPSPDAPAGLHVFPPGTW